MPRILALDVGGARVGIALSDPFEMIATPQQTFFRTGDDQKDAQNLAALIKSCDTRLIICGLPISLNGQENPQSQKVRDFAAVLAAFCPVEIKFWDERLSTVSAERALIEGNVRREKRKTKIDNVAAAIFLQSYLDSKGAKIL